MFIIEGLPPTSVAYFGGAGDTTSEAHLPCSSSTCENVSYAFADVLVTSHAKDAPFQWPRLLCNARPAHRLGGYLATRRQWFG